MVELVRTGRTPGELAREFECSAQASRHWVPQAGRDEGVREDGLTTAEREETGCECERLDRRAFHTRVEARMAIFEFIEGWYNTHRRHSALGSLSPNDFERAAAKAASRAPGNDDRLGRIDLEAFRIDEPEAPNHPPGRPSTSVFGKIFLPSAFAHPRAGSESHHLSTRSG